MVSALVTVLAAVFLYLAAVPLQFWQQLLLLLMLFGLVFVVSYYGGLLARRLGRQIRNWWHRPNLRRQLTILWASIRRLYRPRSKYDLPLFLLLPRRHFLCLDLLVRLLPHRGELGLLRSAEDRIEVNLQGRFQIVAITAPRGHSGHHCGLGSVAGFHIDHRELTGGHLDLAGDFLVVRPLRPFEILQMSGYHDAVVKHLAEHDVIVDHRPGFVRVSPHFYNTEVEINRFLDVLAAFPS